MLLDNKHPSIPSISFFVFVTMSGHGFPSSGSGIHSKTIRIRKNGSQELTNFLLHSSLSLNHFLQAAGNVLDIRCEWAINTDGMVVDDLMFVNDNDVITLSETKTLMKNSTSSNSLINELKFTANGLPTVIGPYSVCEFIGMGGFGEVHRGIHQNTNEEVALKFISKSRLRDVHDALKIQQECQTLLSLKHSNIIHMYSREETSQHWVLAFELMAGGDLHNYLCKRGGDKRVVADVKLTNAESKRVFQQIVNGVSYAHSKYIIHRDLKLENIFLLADNLEKIKIGDFGLSDLFNPTNRKSKFDGMGTLYILPPEVFQEVEADMGCHFDVWALGVLLLTMLNGRLPFSASGFNLTSDCQPPDSVVRSLIVSGKYEMDRISSQAADLIQWMLHKDPLCRATVADIVSHPWFCGGDDSVDDGETTREASLDTSTHYHSTHRRRQPSLPMVLETSMIETMGMGGSQRDMGASMTGERGELPKSSSTSVSGTTPSSLSISKGGRDRDGRRYSDNLVDELDKSTHSKITPRKSPMERMSSERSELLRRSHLPPRAPSGDALDKSIHELSRSTHGLQKGISPTPAGGGGGGSSSTSEKSTGSGGGLFDRFASLSQSAKMTRSVSTRHLASLDDKIDSLGQSLHEAACVRKQDTSLLSKSMHHTQSTNNMGVGSTGTTDVLSRSTHRGKGDDDDDIPLMKTLARESSTIGPLGRRKSSYMDSTQTSLKIPSKYS